MQKLKTEYLSLQDIQIAYTQAGSGKPLLLLHGNSESKSIFSAYQLEHFRQFHTYALDSRGHGQSKSQDTRLSIEQISEDVIRFCNEKAIKDAAVIGYSDGGNIGLFLAKNAPEIFNRVIAISPNTLVSGTTEESLRMFRNMMKVMRVLGMKKNLMRFELMMNDIGISDNDLKSIKTKMCFLYAEKEMIKEDHILHIAGLVPGAEVVKIDNCSHMNIYKQPEAIRVMLDFLS